MRKLQAQVLVGLFSLSFLLTSCQNSSGAVWEDTKTASRYLQRKGMSLFGKTSESRMVAEGDDFYGPIEEEFVPLREEDLKAHVSVPQPKESPGEGGVPGIDMFKKPLGEIASVFRTMHFNTDEHILREEQDRTSIKKIANFLKKHPNTYIFIEGHCDERASESYNLALGTRRSNHVRTLLVKSGVNPDQIFTTSYGKERPADLGHTRAAWKQNRRAEFKLFEGKR